MQNEQILTERDGLAEPSAGSDVPTAYNHTTSPPTQKQRTRNRQGRITALWIAGPSCAHHTLGGVSSLTSGLSVGRRCWRTRHNLTAGSRWTSMPSRWHSATASFRCCCALVFGIIVQRHAWIRRQATRAANLGDQMAYGLALLLLGFPAWKPLAVPASDHPGSGA